MSKIKEDKLSVSEVDFPNSAPFFNKYINEFDQVSSFFSYNPHTRTSIQSRIAELSERKFPREALARVMANFLTPFGISQEQEQQLNKLKQANSVVVIGGQQAGVLTGPLYTLHKAISIIVTAQLAEKEYHIPVVPIFWIAGEDHDFLEVNHTYLPHEKQGQVIKHQVAESEADRRWSIAQRQLDKDLLRDWISDYFDQQAQTEFTEAFKSDILLMLEQTKDYVSFFSGLMQQLFGRYGLLMINSADPQLRQIEGDIFKKIIQQDELIFSKVQESVEKISIQGYPAQIDLGDKPALLFYSKDGERLLLEKHHDNLYRSKDGSVQLSKDELLQIAEEHPERLSNNVITRPFMQENLIPTLFFVAGAGEISYWALLKSYFEGMGLKLPILLPRRSFTYIEKPIQNIMEKHDLSWDILFNSFDAFKENWIAEQDQLNLKNLFLELREQIRQVYKPVQDKIAELPGIQELSEKNVDKVIEQIDYLEKRSQQAFEGQHAAALRQFTKLELLLAPKGQLQERMYAPYYFFNKHGKHILHALIDYELSTDLLAHCKHRLVYL